MWRCYFWRLCLTVLLCINSTDFIVQSETKTAVCVHCWIDCQVYKPNRFVFNIDPYYYGDNDIFIVLLICHKQHCFVMKFYELLKSILMNSSSLKCNSVKVELILIVHLKLLSLKITPFYNFHLLLEMIKRPENNKFFLENINFCRYSMFD